MGAVLPTSIPSVCTLLLRGVHPGSVLPWGAAGGQAGPTPHPYPSCPNAGWGRALRAQAAIWGAAPLSQKHQDMKQLCEDRAMSLWSPPSVAGPCSQHLDTAQQFPLYTGHWTELPHASPKAQGSTFFPHGKGEFSTGDGSSISIPAHQAESLPHQTASQLAPS